MLKLYNTLTRKIEDFKPINPPNVGMYTCGPTVYDHMHIGNLRTFILSDILYRTLEFNGYNVSAVENITDIDDKIIKRAGQDNTTIDEIAGKYTDLFIKDIKKLNIKIENIKQPRATEYIDGMIHYIQELIRKGLAYVEKDGSVYFDISKFPHYGKLSGINNEQLKTGTRVLSDEYSKENVQDFALWKAVALEDEVGFKSPWGWHWGRPGWHIECSVMSQSNLGNRFDMHVGGIDLIFPHHENEIAQSEGKTGQSPFVKYWVHGAHMLVDGKKMSKSLKNFFTLSDLINKGFDSLSLRYLYLQTHYRGEMNFTFEALEAAQTALNRLKDEVSKWDKESIGCAQFDKQFLDAVNDDLNMPKALAVMWELLKSDYPTGAKARSLFKMDRVLGLGLSQNQPQLNREQKLEIPDEIMALIEEREGLRKQKRYHLADQLRNKIKKMGYNVIDKEETVEIKKIEKML